MKLLALTDSNGNIFTSPDFNWGDAGILPYVKTGDTVTQGYIDISTPANWVNLSSMVRMRFNALRNELIGFIPSWASLQADDKRVMVEHFVYPATLTVAELNSIHPQSVRDIFKRDAIRSINGDTDTLFSVWADTNGSYFKASSDAGVTIKETIESHNIL